MINLLHAVELQLSYEASFFKIFMIICIDVIIQLLDMVSEKRKNENSFPQMRIWASKP